MSTKSQHNDQEARYKTECGEVVLLGFSEEWTIDARPSTQAKNNISRLPHWGVNRERG